MASPRICSAEVCGKRRRGRGLFTDRTETFLKTFRFRVKDSASGKHLSAAARAVNHVWNHCNAMQIHALDRNQRWPNAAAFQASTKGASKGLMIPAQTVQGVCEEYLERRYCTRKPKLRWRGRRSLGWVPFKNQTIRVHDAVVRFNGRTIRLWRHRAVDGEIKTGSFGQDARGRWYCNLVVEIPVRPRGCTAKIGIDLGLKALATLSTGEKITHPRAFRELETRLAQAQRANKVRLVRTINAKIANARKDFLQKETTKLADRFGVIMVGNVSASWQHQVNGKSATDASWGLFRNMLRYKAIARGAVYVDVPEAWTTQVCSSCGSKPQGRPAGIADLEVRRWVCSDCGAVHDRDVNAAINIARLGQQALAEGVLT
jgi:transposase